MSGLNAGDTLISSPSSGRVNQRELGIGEISHFVILRVHRRTQIYPSRANQLGNHIPPQKSTIRDLIRYEVLPVATVQYDDNPHLPPIYAKYDDLVSSEILPGTWHDAEEARIEADLLTQCSEVQES